MAQIPKGRLVKGHYKWICRDCAIYFSIIVVHFLGAGFLTTNRPEKMTTTVKRCGVCWVETNPGDVGQSFSFKGRCIRFYFPAGLPTEDVLRDQQKGFLRNSWILGWLVESKKSLSSFFKVTIWSPKWRSLKLWSSATYVTSNEVTVKNLSSPCKNWVVSLYLELWPLTQMDKNYGFLDSPWRNLDILQIRPW